MQRPGAPRKCPRVPEASAGSAIVSGASLGGPCVGRGVTLLEPSSPLGRPEAEGGGRLGQGESPGVSLARAGADPAPGLQAVLKNLAEAVGGCYHCYSLDPEVSLLPPPPPASRLRGSPRRRGQDPAGCAPRSVGGHGAVRMDGCGDQGRAVTREPRSARVMSCRRARSLEPS